MVIIDLLCAGYTVKVQRQEVSVVNLGQKQENREDESVNLRELSWIMRALL